MRFLFVSSVPLFAIGAALCIGCGGDKPADAKAPTGQAPAADTGTPVAVKPPTPETVPNRGDSAGIRISEEIRQKCGIDDSEAFFAFDSRALRENDRIPLDKVAVCFISGPLAGRALRLVGHADPRGTPDYNMRLGHERADTVKAYLVKRSMDTAKVDATSRGAEDAVGTDEIGFAKDRRVDVMLGQ